MRVRFHEDKLYHLTSQFIIRFAAHLHENDIHDISIKSVEQAKSKNDLMTLTTIKFVTMTNVHYTLIVDHANNFACANWNLTVDQPQPQPEK